MGSGHLRIPSDLNWMTSTPPKSTMITIFRYKSHNTIQPKKEKESEKTVSLLKNRQMSIRSIILIIVLLAIFGGFAVVPVQAQDYDLVILNGRVMDPETKYDDISNVGIKDGRIAVITKEMITGKETIDATGHVVAPGFIDAHFHYTGIFGAKVALRDGRTTLIDLEIGTLGTKVDEWYKAREGEWPVNFGAASAHEFARSLVLDGYECIDTSDAPNSRKAGTGWSSKKPSLEEGNKILKIIDEGLGRWCDRVRVHSGLHAGRCQCAGIL